MSSSKTRMRIWLWKNGHEKDLGEGGGGALFAYFQKRGLKAIESAETGLN